MKPRVIASTKILAVALAAAGCNNTAPRPDPGATPTASATAVMLPTAVAPSPAAASTVPDDKADPKLLTLRSELDGEDRASALAKEPHFRPLCDKDGYPLVGNVARKGPAGVQPSAFCADVREKKTKRT